MGWHETYPDTLDTTGIAAFSTGDESDGELYEDDPESPDYGASKPAIKARESRTLWERFPQVPTFNGGMTNGHVGAFAGMSDIQGMDVYIGACAPHITQWGEHPPYGCPSTTCATPATTTCRSPPGSTPRG